MRHVPVLVGEVVELLAPPPAGVVVDCTLGLGGHAEALLASSSELRLIGIDRDPQAQRHAAARLKRFGDRVRIVQGAFGDLEGLLKGMGIDRVAGILADLGVSSMQLETAERGFSFRLEGPLDMRMGPGELTAYEVVNRYPEGELHRILRDYGEERQARRIARALVAARQREPIATTADLRRLIQAAKGTRGARREGRVDPATRSFQAIRIEVNRELVELERLLDQAVRLLDRGGRLVVISYHSLEDRLVKNTLRDLARGEVDQVTGRPRSETRVLEVLTRRPVRPGEGELAANPRARSARLRAARRL